MGIQAQTVEYTDGDVILNGFFAYDDLSRRPRPAVLVAHTWAGRDQFVCDKAKTLATMGYAGFALDMYGAARVGANVEENGTLMQPLLDDRAMLQRRMKLALDTVRGMDGVDANKVAAIGFCFGGLCVLDLARSGADVNGVVSFHGLFNPPGNTGDTPITAKILALHGHEDPMASPESVQALQTELTAARADWQVHVYGNTRHAFTNPDANDPDLGTVYEPDADRRSWIAMTDFLSEIFM